MPTLERAGLWSVWDIKALLPECHLRDHGSSAPRITSTFDDWRQTWRQTSMSDATTGGRQAPRGDDERLEVLRLVQAGEITADEAAQLLDALDRSGDGRRTPGALSGTPAGTGSGRSSARIRLRVSNNATGKANVNLSLPFGLVGTGIALAKRFAPQHVPGPEVLQAALASGEQGKILDVDNDGERVEIWVE